MGEDNCGQYIQKDIVNTAYKDLNLKLCQQGKIDWGPNVCSQNSFTVLYVFTNAGADRDCGKIEGNV